jgi:hypothetical protein
MCNILLGMQFCVSCLLLAANELGCTGASAKDVFLEPHPRPDHDLWRSVHTIARPT